MSKKMEYHEFLNAIVEYVSGYFGEETKVTLHSVYKNNSILLDGITIMNDGCNISPTIYLNKYYEQYESGRGIGSICEDVLCIYEQNRWNSNLDTSFFRDFNTVKERIVFKLISYERNRDLLKDVPHKKILDLAVVYYYILEESKFDNATILIHDSHLDYWDTDLMELDRIAKENSMRILKASIRGMNQILQPLLPEYMEEKEERMFVISNQNSLFGAACILYKDVLREFAIKQKMNLYLLPSSVHEMILIPAADDVNVNYLKDMVREVNATEVSEEEILSDSVYYYSIDENRIQFA